MEVRHRILQFNNSPKYSLLQKELDKLDTSYKKETLGKDFYSIEFIISENAPLFPKVAELIKKHDFYVQVGVHYTQEDIDNAEWVYANAGEFQYPQPENGFLEATYDTSNHCIHCGMGGVQNKPFRLKRDFKQKNSLFLGLHWVFDEIFVRPEAKKIFEKEQVRGTKFIQPVYHKTGQEIEKLYQMIVQTVAEPGLIAAGLSTVTCKTNNEESRNRELPPGVPPYCGRVKYHFPERDWIRFKKNVLEELPDIAKSFEYFGSGGAANRLILMRSRVVKLVSKYNIRGLKFHPLKVVENIYER